MNKIYRILFIALIAIIQTATAQVTLKGVIKDSKTNQPLQGVSISIPHTSSGAITDQQGAFTLQSPVNFDSVYVSFIGYTTQHISVADKSHDLSISLESTGKLLGEVEVLDKASIREPRAASTITHMDLNRSSGLNIQDAMNLVPGVNLQNRTPYGGDRIIIRGYMPNLGNSVNTSNGFGYMAFINNIPITDAIGNTILDDIDMSTLGRIDVIKGPSSSLYGSYVGGSVNFYTPRVASGQTDIREQVIAGSYGLFRTNTTIQTATENSSLWINYGHQDYNGFRPSSASQKDFASLAYNLNVSNKQSISTFFSYSSSFESLAGELDSADVYGRKAVSDTNYMLNNSHVKMESYRAGITDNYKFNEHLSNQTTVFVAGHTLDQSIAHGFTDYNVLDLGGRTAFNYENHGDKIGVNGTLGAMLQKTSETVEGVFILPFHLPPFTPTTAVASYTDQQNYALNYNIFTQWNISLPSQFIVSVGGSMNYSEFGIQNMLNASHVLYNEPPVFHKSFNPVFTPTVSVIKIFSDNMSVYANMGMGYTPAGLSQIITSTGTITAGLKPETAIQYELGTKGSLLDNKLFYNLVVYDLDITNRLTQEYANSVSFYTNAGEQRNMGVELYLAYNLINNKDGAVNLVRPWISYTYDNAKYITFQSFGKSKIGGNDTVVASYSGNKVAGISPNMFNAGLDVGTKMGLYLHGTFRYVDQAPITFDNLHYMKSYSLLGARIGYRHQFGHLMLDVFVGGDNLLGSTYYSSIFIGASIAPLAQAKDGGSGDGYILPAPYAATFYGGVALTYKFK